MKHQRVLKSIALVAQSGSIRKAAGALNITSSALNRQIQDFEAELGTPVFERVAKGVRLNTAGELVIRHIRASLSDFERMQSQILDLAGVRRGHITIAASQAFAFRYLPAQVHAYRLRYPQVSFSVKVQDHTAALASLRQHQVDLALVMQPSIAPDFLPLYSGRRSLLAVMRKTHPLVKAAASTDAPVRLRDCLQYPLALPDIGLAGRQLFDEAMARSNIPARIEIESSSLEFLRDYLVREAMVSFQIADEDASVIAHMTGPQSRLARAFSSLLVSRAVDHRDAAPAVLVLGQLRGRVLPVAAAKFGEQLARDLDTHS